jgi:hypothetical protein
MKKEFNSKILNKRLDLINGRNSLLEMKLKRHKISFQTNGSELIIGKAKLDWNIIVFYIVLPLFFSLFFLIALIFFIGYFPSRAIALIAMVMFSSFVFVVININSFVKKRKDNSSIIILSKNNIQIQHYDLALNFNKDNTLQLEVLVSSFSEELSMGQVVITNKEFQKEIILTLSDSVNDKMLEDDLNWFKLFFENYLKLDPSH